MKQTLDKLYGFIVRLVLMLEEELDELRSKKSKIAINQKKNITDTLNKLVKLIIQLNKISQEDFADEEHNIALEDQDIILRFINKYKDENR
ncbi:MAG: hypothetical protein H6909_04715 [Rickettsiaceae bacterium]|nr:hypothetical protein [Rickettsiaceae bacterium]